MGISLEQINFSYPGHPVLQDVSCRFNLGRFHVILGPNGSGKTTLLDILSGFSQPDSGQVQFEGLPLSSFSQKALARKMALVSQNYDIRFPFTVKDIVLMGRYPYLDRFSHPSAEDIDRAEQAMELTGIQELKHKRVTELSGGEKQRCVFARALCQDTPILLLDEAFSNMDIHHTLNLLKILRQYADLGLKTIIAVLHDINLAACWADTLIFLKSGRVISHGDTDSVFTEKNIEAVFAVNSKVEFNEFSNSMQAFFKA